MIINHDLGTFLIRKIAASPPTTRIAATDMAARCAFVPLMIIGDDFSMIFFDDSSCNSFFLFGIVYDHSAKTHPLFLSKEKEGMAGVYTHGTHKKISTNKKLYFYFFSIVMFLFQNLLFEHIGKQLNFLAKQSTDPFVIYWC